MLQAVVARSRFGRVGMRARTRVLARVTPGRCAASVGGRVRICQERRRTPGDVNRLVDAPELPREGATFMLAGRSRVESGFLQRAVRADRTVVEFAPDCEQVHARR